MMIVKYIISVILVAITCTSDLGKFDSAILESPLDTFCYETNAEYIETSISFFDLYLSRQTSGANILRLHTATKRTNCVYKNNSEFIKAGKIVNVGVGNFIQKKSLNIRFLFIKSVHRLIGLGRLII